MGGFVVEFDIRDPGTFVLQLMVGWYFGDTDPSELPVPVNVGSHVGRHYVGDDASRALIHNRAAVEITLETNAVQVTSDRPRFGNVKCEHGDSEGRWVNMGDQACEPPYCTGNRSATVNSMDVSEPL